MKRWCLYIVFQLFFLLGNSQIKGDVELKTFFAIPTSSSVELKWTISAGFTCNGTDIYWSEDSINFERVGGIAGICGSASSDVSYSFSHKKPTSNKLNYYKLELGTNGDSQNISVFYVDLAADTFLVIPNPADTKTSIYFKNDLNREVSFVLYNNNGKLIEKFDEIFDSKIDLDVSHLQNGYYLFIVLTNEGNSVKGELVIQH